MNRPLATIVFYLLTLCYGVAAYAQARVTYGYDEAGNRVSQTVNSQVTKSTAAIPDSTVSTQSAVSGNALRQTVGVPPNVDTAFFQRIAADSVLSMSDRKRIHFSEWEKELYQAMLVSGIEDGLPSLTASIRRAPAQNALSEYAVGAIPMEEGITLSGARTYTIPIVTAPGMKLPPSISLGYNSQASEGWAGYGWDLQGISQIKLTNWNIYYHGSAKAADCSELDAVFALDGVPLVKNTDTRTSKEYPLVTASGYIIVKAEKNSAGFVSSFTALYPDGRTAKYGIGQDTGSQDITYPIVEMTDVEGRKVVFEYNEYFYNGCQLLSVNYGFTASDEADATITFSYEDIKPYTNRFFAGSNINYPKRISSIHSVCCGDTLASYTLSYEKKDNVSLLTKVGYSSGTAMLPPLEFSYGDGIYNVEDGRLEKDKSLFLSSAFTSKDIEYYYKRGKFVSGSNNDGLLIYPLLPNYGIIDGTTKKYKLGSLYPSDQKILFAPSITDFSETDASITTGSGFQTIEAVDVDGDGIDEIVKVNTDGTVDSYTKLLITVYKCDDYGVPQVVKSFTVNVSGIIKSGSYKSPYYREYFWGDFNGTGRTQLLVMAYDKNYDGYKNYSQTCYATLVDLNARTVRSEDELFQFTQDNRKCLIVCDIDNDSRTELCFATSSGFDIYRTQASWKFAKEASLSSPNARVLNSADNPYYLTDLNGDGYLDILCAPASDSDSKWTRYAYGGKSFYRSTISITSRTDGDKFMFMDVNRDGLADLIEISDTVLCTHININGSSFESIRKSASTIKDTTGIVPCNVVDYCGMSSFIKVDGFYIDTYSYSAPSPEIRHLTRSVDSFGKTTVNSYSYLPKSSLYWTDTTSTASTANGYAFRTLPIYVLTGENAYTLSEARGIRYRSKYYGYFDGVVHNTGLGFCGFSKIRSYDHTGSVTEIADERHNPEKMGVVTKVEMRLSSVWDNPYSVIENTYDSHSTTYGKLSPRLTKSVAADSLSGIITTTEYTYDSYDYPTFVSTGRTTGTDVTQTEKIRRTYDHNADTSRYRLGFVSSESSITNLNGLNLSWERRSVITHDSLFRAVSVKDYVGDYGKIISLPDTIAGPVFPMDKSVAASADTSAGIARPFMVYASNLISETRYEYDASGNVASEKKAMYGATEFTGSTYTYDSKGRFLLSSKDMLGRNTSYNGYNKFGKPAYSYDFLGNRTDYTYDGLGNIVLSKTAAGPALRTEYGWNSDGTYRVRKTSSNGSERIVTYDALGLEIRTHELRFDGKYLCSDREYDAKGRLARESLPYRDGSATLWNTYEYDDYGRQTRYLEASGKETTWVYDGTSITKSENGIASTTTKDAVGNVTSVTDAGGAVGYEYNNDGQPSVLTAPGGVKTTFEYDVYGRRRRLSDPSAGDQLDSICWHADGSSTLIQTTPKGRITTEFDKFGRKISVSRSSGYSTSYKYDGKTGMLTSEISDNGTSRFYSYDFYGRLETVRETVPDGMLLGRTYMYNEAGDIERIMYKSRDGEIATEIYDYTNGHNTKISLTDGTIVKHILSEDNLGNPAMVRTGSIAREYGFDKFGVPTYRKINRGRLQDFSYSFDPQTGNLLSRTDNVNHQTETFEYDALNRLVSVNGHDIVYADNGNVMSIDGVGSMEYGNSEKPYQVTSLDAANDSLFVCDGLRINYTSFSRPSRIRYGSVAARFIYNADGERVKMQIMDSETNTLIRYYIGGRYECDSTVTENVERLYLGGDAYSAPMLYQRTGKGKWTAYNIGRDLLGSVTHVLTKDGTPVAEYSYDPWGRLRNPETLETYVAGEEPELFTGRGFTGHEHLQWCGLINMNARLYDPLTGRFLSPDPYVQMPDFTQNFNRYSYALNNPLKYTDESGEFIFTTMLIVGGICAAVFAAGNLAAHAIRGDNLGNGNWAKYFFSGAAAGFVVGAAGYAAFAGASALAASGSWILSKTGAAAAFSMKWGAAGLTTINLVGSAVNGVAFNNGQWFNNFGKSVIGNFYLDENKSFWGQTWEGISRFTWEAPQQFIGYMASSIRNIWSERVDFWGGATFVTNYVGKYDGQGITIGSFVNVNNEDSKSAIDNAGGFDTYMQQAGRMPEMYAHEYGHILQSKKWGWGYLGVPSLLSLINCGFNVEHHRGFWTEKYANTYSNGYYKKHYSSYIWSSDYPLKY